MKKKFKKVVKWSLSDADVFLAVDIPFLIGIILGTLIKSWWYVLVASLFLIIGIIIFIERKVYWEEI